jgi:hypothetical protein
MTEPEFKLFGFPLKAGSEKASENLKLELINFQCGINLKQKFCDTKC